MQAGIAPRIDAVIRDCAGLAPHDLAAETADPGNSPAAEVTLRYTPGAVSMLSTADEAADGEVAASSRRR